MRLDIQILSFIFSFIFGVFLFFSFNFVTKNIMNLKKLKIIISLGYYLLVSLLYFYSMYIINNGDLHLYFLLFLLFGFLITYTLFKKYCKKL